MAADWVAVAVFVLGATLALAAAPTALSEAAHAATRRRVQRAFERTFQPAAVRRIELRVARGGREVARRVFELSHLRQGNEARTWVRFVSPDPLHGHTLTIVGAEAGEPAAVWLHEPGARRPRRLGSTGQSDAFCGSDLGYEDLALADWRRWRVAAAQSAQEGGLACEVFDAWPPAGSQYGRLRLWLAAQLGGVARVDFHGSDGVRPEAHAPARKRLRVAFAGLEGGFPRVARIVIEAQGGQARTELVVERTATDPSTASFGCAMWT